MASRLLRQKQDGKKMVESIQVRAPRIQCHSRNHSDSCKHFSDGCSAQLLIQNYSNFKESGSPSRFMFYRDFSWVDFPPQVLGTLRAGFLERKPMIEMQIDGSKYLFDFYRMLQVDFDTGSQISISWIDERGNCFFPKMFVSEESMNTSLNLWNPTIEIEIKIDGNSGKRKRGAKETNEEENEVNSTNEHISKMPRVTANDSFALTWPNTKALTVGDSGYTSVSNFFLSSMTKADPGSSITAIYQCTRTGPLERARFDVFQKQNEITTAARGASNMVYAWYGASAKALRGILTHGFGEPIHYSSSYGIGVHLFPVDLPHSCSTLPESDNNGIKHMLLCQVILGKVEKVEAGSQQSHPSNMKFDNGADDLTCPKRYIVWYSNMNRHILPEYVVSFKSTNHLREQLKESSDTKYSLVKLLSKMKNSLPTSKVQEVATLFQTFKAGELAKDAFVKRLRTIAGDEVLLSMIREIRGCE